MTTTTFKGKVLAITREHNYPDGTPKYLLTIIRPDGEVWNRYVEDCQFAYSQMEPWLGKDCVFTENGLMRITDIEDPGEEDRLFLWHVTGEVGGVSVNMYISADDQASAHRKAIDMLDPERLKETSLAVTREWLERRSTEPTGYMVWDNVRNEAVNTNPFDTFSQASAICRSMNGRTEGGRHDVRRSDGSRVAWEDPEYDDVREEV